MSPNPTRWLDDPSFAVDAKALLRSAEMYLLAKDPAIRRVDVMAVK